MDFEPKNSLSPFKWKGEFFQIPRYEFIDGKPVVVVLPPNAQLEEEIKRRVLLNHEPVYRAFDHVCFPEDYQR
jgi:hypothetical protein